MQASIRRTRKHMKRTFSKKLRAKRLNKTSKKVRKESLRVNAEFATIEGAPKQKLNDETFHSAVKQIFEKNAELYWRLA